MIIEMNVCQHAVCSLSQAVIEILEDLDSHYLKKCTMQAHKFSDYFMVKHGEETLYLFPWRLFDHSELNGANRQT